jgi:hypothetical protein
MPKHCGRAGDKASAPCGGDRLTATLDVWGQDHWPRIEEEAMHPAMVKAVAAEHVRDMLASAGQAERAGQARRARRAQRAWRNAQAAAGPAVTGPAVTSPAGPAAGRRTPCPQSAMEH